MGAKTTNAEIWQAIVNLQMEIQDFRKVPANKNDIDAVCSSLHYLHDRTNVIGGSVESLRDGVANKGDVDVLSRMIQANTAAVKEIKGLLIKDCKSDSEPEREKRVMRLLKSDGLFVVIGVQVIAMLDATGKFFVYNDSAVRARLLEWAKDGCVCDSETVMFFRDGHYRLSNVAILYRSDLNRGGIFDFREMRPFRSCCDDNVLRYDHSGTPIVY